METQLSAPSSMVLVWLVCIIIVTGLMKAVNWIWLTPKKLERWLRQQGMAGNPYNFLYGDIKVYSSMSTHALKHPMDGLDHNYFPRIEPFRHHMLHKFGKDYFIWAGPTPMINISKPEMIREALTKFRDIQKPKLNPIVDKLFPGIINYEGEKWINHRKLLNPAFHMEKLKLMMPAFFESCAVMISKLENIVPKTSSCEIDVWPYLNTLTADVISRAAFGSSYEEGHPIFELLDEQTHMALATLQSVYIPGIRYLPTTKNRRFKEVHNRIQTLLKQIIDKRKQEMEAGERVKDDLLSILLASNAEKTGSNVQNQQIRLSIQEVIDECKIFYIAGQDTTSVLLVWTLILLSKHQDWQARARNEVLHTFKKNPPDFDALSRLKTVNMILNEVLRLYPPAIQLNRRVYKDTKVGKLSIPAGALITIPIVLVHRDKEFWGDDVEDFKPDRFDEGISKATNGNNSFFPFGWGPRICIGEKFATTAAKMVVSMMLQSFSFELSPNYVHAPKPVIFLEPQYGAPIILRRL